jgi:hypothetical protein
MEADPAALHKRAVRLRTLPARTLEAFASNQSGRYNRCLGRFEGQYEWDPAKAEANLCKHKISFETATKVFDDPNFLLIEDRTDETGEARWHAIGTVEGVALLLVVHV